MNENFTARINQIQNRLASPEIMNNSGLGNEIGFYIFDYPPEMELAARRHLQKILPDIPRKIAVVNLFELILDYLRDQQMLEPALEMQVESGDAELLSAFSGVIEGARIAPLIVQKGQIETHDMIILTGIGSAYPLIRTHDLLNNMQVLMKNKPLVVFYPGTYSGQTLSLFGQLKDQNYYRAFRLIA